MEKMVTEKLNNSYKGKRVLITGHTGFKGSWLVNLLKFLGANVFGYSLNNNSILSHYSLIKKEGENEIIGDILDTELLKKAFNEFQPEIVFHLAAQAIVRESYNNPVDTYQVNVIGTANLLEVIRSCKSVKSVICITTDKVYENKEWNYAYREIDQLGGHDPYSSSKACCELLVNSYRNSYFNNSDFGVKHDVIIATARAGNVIGGGDWSKDRLIPDIVTSAMKGVKVKIRNGTSIRPWQHVLDCLNGYIILGSKLIERQFQYGTSWNFSPYVNQTKNVLNIVELASKEWGKIDFEVSSNNDNPHEAKNLMLDNNKAIIELGWRPIWETEEAIQKTILWYREFYENNNIITDNQIIQFLNKQ